MWNGTEWESATAGRIFVNDGDLFWPDPRIEAGGCDAQVSLQAWLAHELGFQLGLGTADVPGATMEGPSACDTSGSTLAPDDVDGIQAIYGPPFPIPFTCSATGSDPLTSTCTPVPRRTPNSTPRIAAVGRARRVAEDCW